MSETSLIFLSLIYFKIFQNKTSRQKDRRGEREMRVRVEDKRKSRLLKFSDVVSVSCLLVTTLVDCGPTWCLDYFWSQCSVQAGPGRIIFMIFYYLESKHFLWWWRNSPGHHQPPCSQFFPLNIRPRVYTFSSSQMIL